MQSSLNILQFCMFCHFCCISQTHQTSLHRHMNGHHCHISSHTCRACDNTDYLLLDARGTKISFRLFGLCTLIWPSVPVLSTFSVPFFSSFPLISSTQVKANYLSHNRLLYSFFKLCFTVSNVIPSKDQMQVVFTVMKRKSCLYICTTFTLKTIYSARDSLRDSPV